MIRMFDIRSIIDALPPMLSGKELKQELSILPAYHNEIRKADTAARLLQLSDLYRIYLPSQMSLEIYSKLYLALIRSLQKKGTKLAVIQQNENSKGVRSQDYNGIIGGSDSFTIIGVSGIGKSSAISRAITLITKDQVLETEKPYTKIIPCVTAQCPYDCSVKGMLLEILRKVDETLKSSYYEKAVRARATTDMLIGSVSQAALNHIGLLVVDEIQNVVSSKNGRSLIGALTQLINNSGISICMVGTPECAVFFESAMQLARRSLGLLYNTMRYDDYFKDFCEVLFGYQYVKERSEITPAITQWLYEHSAGVISVVVSLLHDAQEIAILTGKEVLDMAVLEEAYEQRMSLLHDYIKPSAITGKQTSAVRKKKTAAQLAGPADMGKKTIGQNQACSLEELAQRAKEGQQNIVELLKDYVTIEVVAV